MTKSEIQALAYSLGFDLVEVAPVDNLPTIPPWTGSVIVLAMATLDPAFDLELYQEIDGARRWSKWIYERLMANAARLARELVAVGQRAEHLTYDDSLAVLDLKAAAVAAGLGVVGLNNVVVTRRFGPRVRLGAVLTDAYLPAAEPAHDYYCASCSQCVAACPTGALTPDGFHRARCIAEFAPDATMAELQGRLLRFPTPHTRLQCSACVDACPIGRRVPTRFWGLDPR